MLNITDAEKQLYRDDGVNKAVTISVPALNLTIDNDDLIKESVQLTERIETDKNLNFKGCNASVFSFKVSKFTTDIRGQYIEATIQADPNSLTPGEVLPLFSGYVETQSNMNYEDYVCDITAYDPLQRILDLDVTAWYNALTFPITMKNLRDSFFTYVGMTQEDALLVNDNITLNNSVTDPTVTGALVLRSICQLNGRYGQYGRDKKFHYRRLGSISAGTFPGFNTYPDIELYPAEPNANEQILKNLYTSCEYQPYDTKKVTKVAIIGQDGAVKGEYGTTTGDTFYLSDNKLAWGVTNANLASQNILQEVKDISFTPATLNCKGLPYIECGDIVLANTRINAVTSYVLERTLNGIQALTDSFVGQIDEKRKPYTPTLATNVSANEVDTKTAQTSADNAQSTANSASNAASTAQSTADTAKANAKTAQDTADGAVTRISKIESDYVKTAQLTATNANITSLTATVTKIKNAYIDEATCKTIVANSMSSYFASINYLHVSGRISASSGFSIGASTYTSKQANVRLADGTTKLLMYLGL